MSTLLPFLLGFALGWMVQLLLDFFFWKKVRNPTADGTAADTRLEAGRTKNSLVALVENDHPDEPPIYHLPAENQIHSTLCGLAGELDSDGGHPMVGRIHTRVSVPDNVRVNCADCYHIFGVAQKYRIGDFELSR